MSCRQGELDTIFPTVLLRRRLDAVARLNGRLREIVLEREAADPGIVASNVGGWHSKADLHEWAYPEIRQMTAAFLEAGRDLTQNMLPPGIDGEIDISFYGGCWANVVRDGGYSKIHNHPGAVWSGTYYVSIGEPDPGPDSNGCIEFQDPRPGNIHASGKLVPPEPGLLLLFPSWLNHFVNPFRGKGERISIAFNLDAEVIPRRTAPTVAIPGEGVAARVPART